MNDEGGSGIRGFRSVQERNAGEGSLEEHLERQIFGPGERGEYVLTEILSLMSIDVHI